MIEPPAAKAMGLVTGFPLISADRVYVPLLTDPEILVITNLAVVFELQYTSRSN